MKALTLWQPYASAMAYGLKTFETRSWGTNYRGPLAIHAGLGCDGDLCISGEGKLLMEMKSERLPHGVILAVVDLVDCTEMDEVALRFVHPVERNLGDWRVGRFAWACSNLRVLVDPVPCKGKQGLWTIDGEIEKKVWEQLGRAVFARRD